ncbi:MAG: hypothetical protein ACYC96_10560 [Fimbriimonadaceae bacterium]
MASFVEFVEALTIVLAVGVVRGWRSAFAGATVAAVTLAVAIWALGPRIGELNQPLFKLVVGILLLLFGLRWLRKAVLRAAGVIPLHDEARAFERTSEELRTKEQIAKSVDPAAAFVAFNGVFVEGVEVVFIVLAVGGTGSHLGQAALGAELAGAVVVILGIIAQRPLTRIPENALKLVVGALVAAFGTTWTGESLGLKWPGGEFGLVLISGAYAVVAALGVALCRGFGKRGARA